jgi:chromosome segregation ATPase
MVMTMEQTLRDENAKLTERLVRQKWRIGELESQVSQLENLKQKLSRYVVAAQRQAKISSQEIGSRDRTLTEIMRVTHFSTDRDASDLIQHVARIAEQARREHRVVQAIRRLHQLVVSIRFEGLQKQIEEIADEERISLVPDSVENTDPTQILDVDMLNFMADEAD